MKIMQAIIQAHKNYQASADMLRPGIYRVGLKKCIFEYFPEYSTSICKSNDPNCWRIGVGTFGEMLIPEGWEKEEDWEAL